MDLSETAQMLVLVDTLDPYVRPLDEDTQRLRVHAWQTLLRDVPPKFATWWLERAYRHERDNNVQPSEIRSAWLEAERVEEAKQASRERALDERQAAVERGLDRGVIERGPEWSRAYLLRVQTVVDDLRGRGVRYNSPEWRRAVDAVPFDE